jgi:hypothetical protein
VPSFFGEKDGFQPLHLLPRPASTVLRQAASSIDVVSHKTAGQRLATNWVQNELDKKRLEGVLPSVWTRARRSFPMCTCGEARGLQKSPARSEE